MTRHARRVPERIQDVLEAIGNIESDTQGMTEDEFLADGKTQRAVIESLIVIGEAANRIILAHAYFRVDAAIVWTTVQNSLPAFKAELLGPDRP